MLPWEISKIAIEWCILVTRVVKARQEQMVLAPHHTDAGPATGKINKRLDNKSDTGCSFTRMHEIYGPQSESMIRAGDNCMSLTPNV